MHISPQTRDFIRQHPNDDIHSLLLHAHRYPGVDMKLAVTQLSGRKVMAAKVPSWHEVEEIIYPRHLSLEQCSSEVTATYKSTLCNGATLADLTGGMGVDCAFMSRNFTHTTYVEQQAALCELAAHNFPLLGLGHIKVVHADSVEYLQGMDPVDCLFMDPARRDKQGNKTVLLSDCQPDVTGLESLLLKKAKRVIIKLSPMLDITLALKELTHVTHVHILSVQNDCKELLLVLDQAVDTAVNIHCLNFAHNQVQEFVFTKEEEINAPCSYANRMMGFLYEPNAAVLKAGGYKCVASRYRLAKLHPNSHLYMGDEYIQGFPGRVFRIEGIATFGHKNLLLKGISQAHITTRNFPLPAPELRKRLKLKDGGEVYLFATTLQPNQKVLISCSKVTAV